MLCLRAVHAPPHHLPLQIRADRANILHHVLRDLDRLLDALLRRVCKLSEQAVQKLVVRPVHGSRRYDVQSSAVADEPGEEVRGCAFHRDTSPAKDESNLRRAQRDPDCHGQSHCNTDADCGALDGANDGLCALVYR